MKDFGDVEMPTGCVVHGRVVDDAGQPRSAAYVRLFSQEASRRGGRDVLTPRRPDSVRTKVDGTFRIKTPVAPGKWMLLLRGERDVRPNFVKIGPNDRDRELTIKVKSKASIPSIHGVVVDESGQPVRGAAVTVIPASGAPM